MPIYLKLTLCFWFIISFSVIPLAGTAPVNGVWITELMRSTNVSFEVNNGQIVSISIAYNIPISGPCFENGSKILELNGSEKIKKTGSEAIKIEDGKFRYDSADSAREMSKSFSNMKFQRGGTYIVDGYFSSPTEASVKFLVRTPKGCSVKDQLFKWQARPSISK